ncbi:tensin-1-like isoform X3 [Artemia franciscana]
MNSLMSVEEIPNNSALLLPDLIPFPASPKFQLLSTRSFSTTDLKQEYRKKSKDSNFISFEPKDNFEVLLYRLSFSLWHCSLLIPIWSQKVTQKNNVENQKLIDKQIKNGKAFAVISNDKMNTQSRKNSLSISPSLSQAGIHLSYVTEKILSLGFDESTEAFNYRNGLKSAASMLRRKHGDKYIVLNLSAPRRVLSHQNPQVVDFGWPSTLAPPLERLCGICKRMDDWLQSDPKHVVVLHSRRGLQRIGVALAAYMQYVSVCGGDEQALDRFAMQRFLDEKVPQTLFQPSDLRYVNYFGGLLSGAIRVNAAPLFLHYLTFVGVPNFDKNEGCKPFIKVYEGRVPVYTSGIYNISCSSFKRFTLSLGKGTQLRGDILIRCYNRTAQSPGRELIFSCQFHTCAVVADRMIVPRAELDYACRDLRFPLDGGIILHFSDGPNARVPPSAPVLQPVEVHGGDPITRWDSLDTFGCHTDVNDADDDATSEDDSTEGVSHFQGPVDSSLYATVAKKKLTPPPSTVLQVQTEPSFSPRFVNSNHVASMDSGISSAGISGGAREQHLSGSSASPPYSAQSRLGDTDTPSPALLDMPTAHVPPQEMSELDTLLNGMMMNVQNIRELRPEQKPRDEVDLDSIRVDFELKSPKLKKSVEFNETVKMNKSEIKPLSNGVSSEWSNGSDEPIPYHARTDSKPFTYGLPNGSESPSIHRRNSKESLTKTTAPGLSSPSLVRKFSTSNDRGTPTPRSPLPHVVAPVEDIVTVPSPRLARKLSGNLVPPSATSTPTPARSPVSPMPNSLAPPPLMKQNSDSNFLVPGYRKSPDAYYGTVSSPKTVRRNASFRYEAKTDSSPLRLEDTISDIASSIGDTSRYSDSSSNWLQRQQTKLRERREYEKRLDRNTKDSKLIHELRAAQVGRTRTSRPDDGYLSDTTQFSELGTSREGSPDLYGSVSLQLSMQSDVESSKCASPLKYPVSPPGSPLIPHRSASRDVSGPYYNGDLTIRRQKSDSIDRSYTLQRNQREDRKTSEDTNPLPYSACEKVRIEKNWNAVTRATKLEALMQQISMPEDSLSSMSVSIDELDGPSSEIDRVTASAYPALNNAFQYEVLPDNIESDESSNRKHLRVHFEGYSERTQDDSVISWEGEISPRPTTPAFPVGPRTPYVYQQGLPPKSPATMRKDRSPSPGMNFGTMDASSRRSSLSEPADVSPVYVKFAKDTSKYWYKPSISREEAINTLKDKMPGTFIVRDSSSFPGAFGLALKVATPPAHLTDPSPNDLVRHFLIEPTSRGVRLKGNPDEPVFGSLSALVYQHSVKAMALPCRLLLPDCDVAGSDVTDSSSTPQYHQQGAACNVFYLFTMDCESLTGPQAVARCIQRFVSQSQQPAAVTVNFKVSLQGITLTDHQRKLFFRRHYPLSGVTHCGLDTEDRKWAKKDEKGNILSNNRYFGFVARKPGSSVDNQVHIFAEYELEQPASAIVSFVNRILTSTNRSQSII